MFFHLWYNIKSVLNVYYFAEHNFYLCYKILKEKLRKIFLIFKANRLLSMARWHNGYYSLNDQIRPFPLERNHLSEGIPSITPQLELNVLSTMSYFCIEKVTRQNRIGQRGIDYLKSMRKASLTKNAFSWKAAILLMHGPILKHRPGERLDLSESLWQHCVQRKGGRPSPRCWIQAREEKPQSKVPLVAYCIITLTDWQVEKRVFYC